MDGSAPEDWQCSACQIGGYKPKKIIDPWRDWLLARMKAGDFTLQGLADKLEAQGLKVDCKTVWTFVHDEGQSFKKARRASEQQRPDVARRCAVWIRVQPHVDASGFVCIDENWTKTNMAPLHGGSCVGERCIADVPHSHWITQTWIAGLTPSGIDAPYVFDGPINGESFLAYVEQMLVPELLARNTVILDNLGNHKNDAVRQAIRKTRARLFFLPPYSPDLNPIKQAFSKLKHMLRKAK